MSIEACDHFDCTGDKCEHIKTETDLAKLKKTSSRIGAKLDRLNAVIAEMEARLESCQIVAAAHVSVENGIEIGYHKITGFWRIVLRETPDKEWRPAQNVPAHLRSMVVSGFPVLVEALTKQADKLDKELDEKLKARS